MTKDGCVTDGDGPKADKFEEKIDEKIKEEEEEKSEDYQKLVDRKKKDLMVELLKLN
jgi:hypothetical protein